MFLQQVQMAGKWQPHAALLLLQVTDMVEGEIATASREVPRFAAGGKSSSGSSDAAARLASRQRLATRYSRFEAEVRQAGCLQGVARANMQITPFLVNNSSFKPKNATQHYCRFEAEVRQAGRHARRQQPSSAGSSYIDRPEQHACMPIVLLRMVDAAETMIAGSNSQVLRLLLNHKQPCTLFRVYRSVAGNLGQLVKVKGCHSMRLLC